MDISILDNHDFGLLDSFAKSTKSSLPNPPRQIQAVRHLQNDDLGRDEAATVPLLDRGFTGPLAALPRRRLTPPRGASGACIPWCSAGNGTSSDSSQRAFGQLGCL